MDHDLKTRLLAMIALFEGSSGGRINVWDEQYLSLGTLHYAVGQGPGARFLMRVYELDPVGTLSCLGAPFVQAIKGGPASIRAYCKANVWKTENRWNKAFAALSRLPAYQQADAELAEPYLQGAVALARRYGLTSERGLAFALDRCVQQGTAVRGAVDQAYARVKGQDEVSVMAALAEAYAHTANPKYLDTVRKRSLTVAKGCSRLSGYPGDVDLERDFGLRLDRPWEGVAPGVPRVFLVDGGGKTVEWDGDESGVYGGQPLTRAWFAQMALVYPPGTQTQVGGVSLERFADGAIRLNKFPQK
ncbi:glycosyl hydrolase [Deinococcus sp. S9]|uniref:glycosyl hydrolase n=1 Tax=Deinococcus sp. S9 TaxID=2545754 RepID=UPI001056D249|nr:glycosyl hydrolase [Deinococcus sp. S9]TDE87341.1 glycosyl hydrolase [Deinococcus sp. S9]